MRHNLIKRLKEEWAQLDPVDPLRGVLSDAIDALAKQSAQPSKPVAWQWKDTMNFRKTPPPNAEPGVWRPVYANENKGG